MPDFNVSNKLSELEQLKSLVHFYHGLNSPFSLRFDIAITSFSKLMKINDPNSTEEKYFLAGLHKNPYQFSVENTHEIPCFVCS